MATDYRVENKYVVSDRDIALLKSRLNSVLKVDKHQKDDSYLIRSLYFDTYGGKCANENDAGVDDRKKYRIRIYDASDSLIHLEIKQKKHSLTRKTSCDITKEETLALMSKELWNENLPEFGERKALNDFLIKRKCQGLLPKAIIEYERSAYVYPIGNVRITIDRNISASSSFEDFFSHKVGRIIPVMPKQMHILEVKYDELIPDFILQALQVDDLQKSTFSKYYLGTLALEGQFETFI